MEGMRQRAMNILVVTNAGKVRTRGAWHVRISGGWVRDWERWQQTPVRKTVRMQNAEGCYAKHGLCG